MAQISILMCNYNNAQFLPTAIESVIAQSYQNWELSVVDDCSTDNSVAIIQGFMARESRIKLFVNPVNLGYGKSIAKNIEIAKGILAGILDPDDALENDAIEIMLLELEKNPAAVAAYSQLWYCDENLTPLKIFEKTRAIPQHSSYLETGNMAMTHFFVFHRQKLLDYGNVDTNYRNALDQDWYFKMEEIGPVLFVPKPLYYYRVSPFGLSQGTYKKYVTAVDCFELKKKAIERRKLSGSRRRQIIYASKAELFYFKAEIAAEEKKIFKYLKAVLLSNWYKYLKKI